jgi:hypothetical protein
MEQQEGVLEDVVRYITTKEFGGLLIEREVLVDNRKWKLVARAKVYRPWFLGKVKQNVFLDLTTDDVK